MSQSGGKKVFVGLSGGVDSAVSAALLKERGFDVTGVFIKTWHPDFAPCDWKEDRRDAMRAAAALGIPFLTLDLEEEYKKGVADYMIEEYRKGRTPNPDVCCNKEVKFGGFLRFALESGADAVATGHYARAIEAEGAFRLLEGADKNKDQSYFLWTLTQERLRRIMFPVGGLEKAEVRKLAERFGLPNARKKDSQGVCFLGEVDMKDFLSRFVESGRGDVLDVSGNAIGRHDGALFYTLGERLSFEAAKKGTNDQKLYVISKDMERNTVTVSPDPWDPAVNPFMARSVRLEGANWIAGAPEKGRTYSCRYRYRQAPVACEIEGETARFAEPQAGASPGQSLVVYDGEECLGGGVIS